MSISAIEAAKRDRYKEAGPMARVRRHPAGPVGVVFFGLLIACVIAGLVIPAHFDFLNPANLTLILRQIPAYGMVALGVGLLMITGEFDLSVGSVFVVAPFAMGYAAFQGLPFELAVVICLAVAVLVGLLNGLITLRFGIPSFITTLGMLFIVRTAAPFIVGYTRSVSFKPPPVFKEVLTGNLVVGGFQIPAQFLWFLVMALIAYLLLNRHFLGNHFFAAGGNTKAARYAGINVERTKLLAFVLCSVFSAISGVFAVTRLGTAMTNPQLFIELYAVAICVIGGLSLYGGRGSVIGIVFGAALLQLVQDIIILARLPGFYLDLFVGLMIVAGVVMNQFIRRR